MFVGLSQAWADTLPKPSGVVILTVSGAIGRGNDVDAKGRPVAKFDLAMLEGLGMRSVKTATPWHQGAPLFEGPAAADLLKAVAADGVSARAIALNDYVVEVPLDDFRNKQVIFALKMNGKNLTVRDKGPVFIMYPFDKFPREEREVYYSRAAWQLARLEVQ